jgi:hypothetical protein
MMRTFASTPVLQIAQHVPRLVTAATMLLTPDVVAYAQQPQQGRRRK